MDVGKKQINIIRKAKEYIFRTSKNCNSESHRTYFYLTFIDHETLVNTREQLSPYLTTISDTS